MKSQCKTGNAGKEIVSTDTGSPHFKNASHFKWWVLHIGIRDTDPSLKSIETEVKNQGYEITESSSDTLAYRSSERNEYFVLRQIPDDTIIIFVGDSKTDVINLSKDFTFEVEKADTEESQNTQEKQDTSDFSFDIPQTQNSGKSVKSIEEVAGQLVIPSDYEQYTHSEDEIAWMNKDGKTIHLMIDKWLTFSFYEEKYPDAKRTNGGLIYNDPNSGIWFVLPNENSEGKGVILVTSEDESILPELVKNL